MFQMSCAWVLGVLTGGMGGGMGLDGGGIGKASRRGDAMGGWRREEGKADGSEIREW
mgnify:CR=1 FL=1